jgi:hypothetical protein
MAFTQAGLSQALKVSDCGALILWSWFCGQIIGVVQRFVQLLLA